MIMSIPLVRYVLVAAMRDKLIWSMVLALVLGSSLSLFFGGSAIIERDQFTLVFAAGALRLISVMGLVLFVVFFVRRSFDSKDIEFLLSRPVDRLQIILSYISAFAVMAVLIGLAVMIAVFASAPKLFGYDHFIWGMSIIIEGVVMVSIALFFSMQIASASSAAMLSLAVYVLGRLMGQLLGIIDAAVVDTNGVYAITMQVVSVITPRLDLLGQTSWLLYGLEEGSSIVFAFLHGVIFSLFVVAATCLDFSRKAF